MKDPQLSNETVVEQLIKWLQGLTTRVEMLDQLLADRSREIHGNLKAAVSDQALQAKKDAALHDRIDRLEKIVHTPADIADGMATVMAAKIAEDADRAFFEGPPRTEILPHYHPETFEEYTTRQLHAIHIKVAVCMGISCGVLIAGMGWVLLRASGIL